MDKLVLQGNADAVVQQLQRQLMLEVQQACAREAWTAVRLGQLSRVSAIEFQDVCGGFTGGTGMLKCSTSSRTPSFEYKATAGASGGSAWTKIT